MYSYSFSGSSTELHFEDYNDAYSAIRKGIGFSGACGDLSQCDAVTGGIVPLTSAFLDSSSNSDINVIMWSWCSIESQDITGSDGYLNNMKTLIERYPDVTFVFITGHVD